MLEDKLRFKKGDYYVFLFAVVMIIILLCLNLNRKHGAYVRITVDDITNTYSLIDENVLFFSDGKQVIDENHTNITNTIVIKDGEVYMKNADCPDQLCVKHKPISKNGEMIICLPNQIFVEIESDIANDIDN